MLGARRGIARFAAAGLLAVAAVLAPARARAQSAQSAAAAQVLFEEAKTLMHEKRYAEACAKFVESNRLDAGIGTMLWLADCYEKNGQTASAWAEFVEAADLSDERHDERRKVARERAAALETSLPKLTVDVTPAVVSDAPGLEITRDGAVVGRAVWGTPVPVDPGTHTIVARAPAHKPWQATVTVESGGRATTTVPMLPPERSPEAPSRSAPASATAPAPPDSRRTSIADKSGPGPGPTETQEHAGSSQRVWGVVTGGVGLGALGVGLVLGWIAKSHLDESNADHHCTPDNHCDAIGTAARNEAFDTATASTITCLAGGAVLAAGLVLYVTAPSSPRVVGARAGSQRSLELRPLLGAHEQGLVLRASF
jgi:serine/threonine-protein kinase